MKLETAVSTCKLDPELRGSRIMRQENVESRKARALSSGSEDSDKEEKSSIVIPLRDGDSSQIFCRSTVI